MYSLLLTFSALSPPFWSCSPLSWQSVVFITLGKVGGPRSAASCTPSGALIPLLRRARREDGKAGGSRYTPGDRFPVAGMGTSDLGKINLIYRHLKYIWMVRNKDKIKPTPSYPPLLFLPGSASRVPSLLLYAAQGALRSLGNRSPLRLSLCPCFRASLSRGSSSCRKQPWALRGPLRGPLRGLSAGCSPALPRGPSAGGRGMPVCRPLRQPLRSAPPLLPCGAGRDFPLTVPSLRGRRVALPHTRPHGGVGRAGGNRPRLAAGSPRRDRPAAARRAPAQRSHQLRASPSNLLRPVRLPPRAASWAAL